VPEDAWSHGQVGTAYREIGEYEKALDAYTKAGERGDAHTALLGRAEVLKDLGQFENAMAILSDHAAQFPGDKIARNSMASALAASGRFGESLRIYDELCDAAELDPVSLTARAGVYRSMGNLEGALRELNSVVSWFPDHAISKCLRGDVLREKGCLEEALDWFNETARRFPRNPTPRTSAAKVIRDLGDIDSARNQYKLVVTQFSKDPIALIGLAEIEKTVGSLTTAEREYRTLLERFPYHGGIKNGLAAVLTASGRYVEALDLLPDRPPASRSQWAAFHIRGMVHLRSGNLQDALAIFERGLAETPWFIQRSLFRTSLAGVAIRQEQHQKALDLLDVEPTPLTEPIAELFRIHAQAALGRSDGMEIAVRESLATARTPVLIALREELLSRFGDAKRSPVGSNDALFQKECDVLLLAA
jgi:tetratricopeptide (TPR) repeat protein